MTVYSVNKQFNEMTSSHISVTYGVVKIYIFPNYRLLDAYFRRTLQDLKDLRPQFTESLITEFQVHGSLW